MTPIRKDIYCFVCVQFNKTTTELGWGQTLLEHFKAQRASEGKSKIINNSKKAHFHFINRSMNVRKFFSRSK